MQDQLKCTLDVFRENPSASDEELLEALCAAGIERRLAAKIIQFMPPAFMRVQFRESGPHFSDKYMLFRGNQNDGRTFPLTSEPVFNAALELARAGVSRDEMLAVLRRSSEYIALGKALRAGEQPGDLVMSPVGVFADWGRTDEA
ncbi:MAG: hypothetical protein IT450_15565 [Phycisphaerales bacterium]|nr:hypothetical protein [Phycisphaerales bacterium]